MSEKSMTANIATNCEDMALLMRTNELAAGVFKAASMELRRLDRVIVAVPQHDTAESIDQAIEVLLAVKAARFPDASASLLEKYRTAITVDLAEVEKREAEHLAALTAAYQQHTFKPWTTKSLDDIDASVVSGDEFIDKTARAAFRWYLARWERQMKLFDASDDDSNGTTGGSL